MEYHLAALNLRIGDDAVSPVSLRENGDSDLSAVLRMRRTELRITTNAGHASFLETDIGIATIALLRAPLTEKTTITKEWENCFAIVGNAINQVSVEDHDEGLVSDDASEVLYGRAGLLYALLLLRSWYNHYKSQRRISSELYATVQELFSDDALSQVVNSIILHGRYGSSIYKAHLGYINDGSVPPLMWSWHHKRYLGGAHGIAGILHMLLLCPVDLFLPFIGEILGTIEWMLECQDAEGNWPTQAPGKNQVLGRSSNELVQWCHGAPGTLLMLSTLLRLTRQKKTQIPLNEEFEKRIISAIHRGADLTYRHGLLRKGIGLCHGAAGSVFALLAVSDVLDIPSESVHQKPYLTEAVHLAYNAVFYESLTSRGEMREPDKPWSLYEGAAGMCVAWGEIIYRLQSGRPRACSGMPGFDDLFIPPDIVGESDNSEFGTSRQSLSGQLQIEGP